MDQARNNVIFINTMSSFLFLSRYLILVTLRNENENDQIWFDLFLKWMKWFGREIYILKWVITKVSSGMILTSPFSTASMEPSKKSLWLGPEEASTLGLILPRIGLSPSMDFSTVLKYRLIQSTLRLLLRSPGEGTPPLASSTWKWGSTRLASGSRLAPSWSTSSRTWSLNPWRTSGSRWGTTSPSKT